MKTKVSLTLNAKSYDIDVENDFADYLVAQMKHDFNFEGNNDHKQLLQAYIRRSFLLYEQEKQINALVDKLQS